MNIMEKLTSFCFLQLFLATSFFLSLSSAQVCGPGPSQCEGSNSHRDTSGGFSAAALTKNLPNVYCLQITNQDVTSLQANNFVNIPYTRKLLLCRNNMNSIHNEAFKASGYLTYLYLSFNDLTAVPNVSWKATRLQLLDLSYNKLTSIPACVFNGLVALRNLYLNDNQLTSLPDIRFIGSSSGYTNVFAQNNRINSFLLCPGKQVTASCQRFETTKTSLSLDISGNDFSGVGPLDFSFFGNTLRSLTVQNSKVGLLSPCTLCNLTRVTNLRINKNPLVNIPDVRDLGICEYGYVKVDMSDNAISFSSSCSNLYSASHTLEDHRSMSFYLYRNRFQTFPQSLLQVSPLVYYLDISNNLFLPMAPCDLAHFLYLRTLKIKSNNLVKLPDPRPLGSKAWGRSYIDASMNVINGFEQCISYPVDTSCGTNATDIDHIDLNLAGNNFTKLTSEMSWLGNSIHSLDFTNNKIQSIEACTFYGMSYLVSLDLERNYNNYDFPDIRTFGNCTAGHITLNLKYNSFIDNAWRNTLNLECEIEPSNISCLPLLDLDMTYNKLTKFPIFPLMLKDQISTLDLRYNSINHLKPCDFIGFSRLKEMKLQYNSIEKLPDPRPLGIETLTGYTTLRAEGNQIKGILTCPEVPAETTCELEYRKIPNLKLYLANNRFMSSPHLGWLGNGVSYIDLSNNDIESINPCLFVGMTHLTYLNMAKNAKIDQLPDLQSFGNCIAGKTDIYFDRNLLSSVGRCVNTTLHMTPEFMAGHSLSIDLSNNKYTEMPAFQPEVKEIITYLDLSGNSFTTMQPCDFIGYDRMISITIQSNLINLADPRPLGVKSSSYTNVKAAENDLQEILKCESIPITTGCDKTNYPSSNFSNIKLYLSGNNFNNFGAIGWLGNALHYLDISSSNIVNFDPCALVGLTYLTNLVMNSNSDNRYFPDLIGVGSCTGRYVYSSAKDSIINTALQCLTPEFEFTDTGHRYSVNFYNNKFTRIPQFSVPVKQNIYYFNLRYNDIVNMPSCDFEDFDIMERIYLQNNELRKLADPRFLGRGAKVYTYLYAYEGNVISDILKCSSLPVSFSCDKESVPSQNSSDVRLYLSNNKISNIADFGWMGNSINYIQLRRNDIRTIGSCAFAGLTYLTTLDIQENGNLGTLPDVPGVGLCSKSYVRFYASRAGLSSSNICNIATSILSGSNLEKGAPITMYATYNSFTGMPILSSYLKDNLQYLGLDRNEITSMPPCFFVDYPNLKTLNIGYNNLVNLADPRPMASVIGTFKRISASFNVITDISKCLSLPPANTTCIRNHTIQTCVSFTLSYNKVTNIDKLGWLGDTICSLSLSYNIISNIDPCAFTGLTQLRTLNLDYNSQLGKVPDLQYIGNCAKTAYATITMKVTYPTSGLSCDPSTLDNFIAPTSPNFIYLDLSQNELDSLPSLSNQTLHSLKYLLLSRNLFSSMPSIDIGTNLLSIDLSYNNIVTVMAGDFDNLTELDGLKFDYNRFTTIPYASAFGNVGPQLKVLSLTANPINFIDPYVLRDFTSLKHFTLNDAQITLIPRLEHNQQLESISLQNNSIIDPTFTVSENSSLFAVFLTRNLLSQLPFPSNPLYYLREYRTDFNNIASVEGDSYVSLISVLEKMPSDFGQYISLADRYASYNSKPGYVSRTRLRLKMQINQISTLPDIRKVNMSAAGTPVYTYFSNNPFHCDCSLIHTLDYQWRKYMKSPSLGTVICAHPTQFSSLKWGSKVKYESATQQCQGTLAESDNHFRCYNETEMILPTSQPEETTIALTNEESLASTVSLPPETCEAIHEKGRLIVWKSYPEGNQGNTITSTKADTKYACLEQCKKDLCCSFYYNFFTTNCITYEGSSPDQKLSIKKGWSFYKVNPPKQTLVM